MRDWIVDFFVGRQDILLTEMLKANDNSFEFIDYYQRYALRFDISVLHINACKSDIRKQTIFPPIN